MPIQYGGGGGGGGGTTPVSFSCHMANTQALSSGATATLVYDTVDYNVGGGTFNVATGVYTVPVAGKYLVLAGVRVNDAQGELDLFTVQNATNVYPGGVTLTTAAMFANLSSCIANCAANDTLKINVYLSANTHTNVTQPFNTLQVCKVG